MPWWGAMPVVVVNPALEHGVALRGMIGGDAVGPLAKGRLDEAFGLAVALGPVRSGETVPDAQASAGPCEVSGAESRTIVGENAPHVNPQGAEVGDHVFEKLRRLRNSTMAEAFKGAIARGLTLGRDERSRNPASPSAR